MNLERLARRLKAQYPLHPEAPLESGKTAVAGVLVILHACGAEPHVLLIKRSHGLRAHPGEIGFPGGLFEEPDGDLLTTALRETREELALDIPRAEVLAQLPEVHTRTRIAVTPFVTLQPTLAPYTPNPGEVEEVLSAPLRPLLASGRPEPGKKEGGPASFAYWHGGHRVWGATAHILQRLGEEASRSQ